VYSRIARTVTNTEMIKHTTKSYLIASTAHTNT
jgi:hypothetical protein